LIWLIELHKEYQCICPETLHLTANIIHRFLARTSHIHREVLQLVGPAAFLVASKYEDIFPPTPAELVYFSSQAFNRNDIIVFETWLLKKFDCIVGAPIAYPFLTRFLQAASADDQVTILAHYPLEGTLLSYNLLCFRLSELAAAIVLIAQKAIHPDRNPWTLRLEYHA
jgi:Cyclin, N-terminal domain/Cyclin, C-terminal domain